VAVVSAKRAARQRSSERYFRTATLVAALLVLALLGGVAVASSRARGRRWLISKLDFLTREIWNPVTEQFGALAPIYGTLVTSLIAMLLAVPIGFGIAIFLTELCPRRLRRAVGVAIELLAAVPSIIFGIWGLFVLAPILQRHVQPWLIAHAGPLPGIGRLFQGPPFGIGVLSAVSCSQSWCCPSLRP